MKNLYISLGFIIVVALLFVYLIPRHTETPSVDPTPTYPIPASMATSAEKPVVNTPQDFSINHKD